MPEKEQFFRPETETASGQELLEQKAREAQSRDKTKSFKLSEEGVAKDAQELLKVMQETAKERETADLNLEQGPVLTHEQAVEAINKVIDAGGDGNEWTEFLQKNM